MNRSYQNILQSFKKWLQTLGYAESTVYASVNYTRDFFTWLESNQVNLLNEVTGKMLQEYHRHLETRKNRRRSGSLSVNYITGNINALKRLSKYLQETGKGSLEVELKARPDDRTIKTILTPAEVQALYRACDSDYLGIRDRAILAIYYGCGLRKSEGLALDTSDVLLREKRILVRKGKHYRQRWVPITESVKEDLEEYLFTARQKILSFKPVNTDAFFLSMRVNRMCGNALIERIHRLTKAARIEKQVGLHTLRHSIATHLLQSGLELEEVSRFLGHSSLESTQIYTHLAHEI